MKDITCFRNIDAVFCQYRWLECLLSKILHNGVVWTDVAEFLSAEANAFYSKKRRDKCNIIDSACCKEHIKA
ncbi:hypothetical protein SAMN05421818_11242 [Myroides phaeus]|uniref:Uncharacterized protein n=1 Tax=Myroides phaeus TaxID=702745 RepID=A0A1G8ES17_9FLAO|nr:hypothetical protein SAMN05421818_11242 [Myroides phaeus]